MVGKLITDMARSIGEAGWPALKRAAGTAVRFVPVPQPTLLVGPGSSLRLAASLAAFGHRRVLLVTDRELVRLGHVAPFVAALKASGVAAVVFDRVLPDAPIPVIEAGMARLAAGRCDAVVALGGGSVIDAAKVIALASADGRPPRELAGWFRARRAPRPLYVVPTTAGTGSEVTVAAVIADTDPPRKLTVVDTRLVPTMAALDAALMTGLPPAITAATGMDALTHAVEAFIGGWATAATDRLALAAVRTIWTELPKAVADGSDLAVRERMALASCWAGQAFTRASVGNVHALAHALGAWYHVPHGLANAMLLPGALRFSLPAAADRLEALAQAVGVPGGDTVARAEAFCDAVQGLADRLGIPRHCDALREADLPVLAAQACREADLNYPVPRRMSPADAEALLRALRPADEPSPRRRRRAAAAAG